MELKSYIWVVARWFWLIILATALSAGVSYWNGSKAPRVYEARTALLVGHTLQTQNPNPGDIETSQILARSYVQLVKSKQVLQATVSALHLNMPWYDLSPEVNGTVISGTETIEIAVVDRDPKMAQVIANELARQLILQSPTPQPADPQRQFTNEQMQKLQDQIKATQAQITALQKKADSETSAQALQDEKNQIYVLQQKVDGWQNTYAKLSNFYQGSQTNYLSVVRPAVLPVSPVGTSVRYNTVLAGAIGFALAVAGVIVVEMLDDTLKTERDLSRVLARPIIGGIGWAKIGRQPNDKLIASSSPRSSVTESFRYLAATVGQLVSKGCKVILITSPGPADGKTTVAVNLAIVLSQFGKRVTLVDANLHRPAVHALFDLPNREGVTTFLIDSTREIRSLMLETPVKNLQVLPSGPLPPNPGDLLGSDMASKLVDQLRNASDVVIVDTPAVLGAADTALLARSADTILVVVASRRTRRPMAEQMLQTLADVGAQVHGVIFNGHGIGKRSYQTHYTIPSEAKIVPEGRPCPFLGLRFDRSSIMLAASDEHRCYACKPFETIQLAHQREYCLTSCHSTCQRFGKATVPPPVDSLSEDRRYNIAKQPG